MTGDPARASLDAEILAWMREPGWQRDEERFERLALALFAFQFEHCSPYRRFCERRERTPAALASWREEHTTAPLPAASPEALTTSGSSCSSM